MASAIIGALRVALDLGVSGWTKGLSQAERDANQFAGKLEAIGNKMTKVGAAATAGLTLPILGAGAAVVKMAANFETAMNRVGIATQASGAQMRAMNDLALELGKSTVFSASEAAGAMEELAKTGVSVEDILGGATKAAVDLAAATGSELAPAAVAVSDAMNQFHLSAKDLPGVVNQITGAVNESKLDFADFQLGIAQAGGVAGALGVTFEDFNAVLAGTSSLFASGSDAGTSFKTFLTSMVPKSKGAAAAMEEYGLQFYDAQGKMKSMSDIAAMLQDKLGGLNAEAKNNVLSTIFGTDAMRTAVGLMTLGGKGLDTIADKIKKTDAAAQSAERMKGFNAQMEQLGGSLETLAIKIGQSGLLTMMTSFVGVVADLVDRLTELSPMAVQAGVGVAAIAAAVGPLLLIFGPLISTLGVVISQVMGAIFAFQAFAGGAATALEAAALAPLLPILAGIAAAVAAIWIVWKNWDSIAPVLQNLWQTIVSTIGPPLMNLISAIKEALVALWQGGFGSEVEAVISTLMNLAAIFAQSLGSAIPGILKALASIVGGVFNIIAEALRLVVSLLTGDWAGAWEHAKGIMSAFGNMVAGVFSGLSQAVIGYVSSMVKGIDQWLGTNLGAIWKRVQVAIDKVKGFFFGLYDAVVGHSYVPDMVDGIAAHMARLDAVMVDPAKKATKKVADSMKALAEDLKPILERLFPDSAAMNKFATDAQILERALKRGILTSAEYAEAMKRLEGERDQSKSDASAAQSSKVQGIMDSLFPKEAELRQRAEQLKTLQDALAAGKVSLEDFNRAVAAMGSDPQKQEQLDNLLDSLFPDREKASERAAGIAILDAALVNGTISAEQYTLAMKKLLDNTATDAETKTARIIESFAKMADGVLNSLRSMISAFKSGDILGGIQGVLGLLGQVANVVAGISGKSNPFQALSTVGSSYGNYGGGKALGGPVVAGKSYRVGERGPEWFTPGTGGKITPDGAGGAGMTVIFQGVMTTDEFWDEVDRRDGEAATKGAVGGAQLAIDRSTKRQMRRLV